MNDPFLHLFNVNGRDYVYDTRSNLIFETSTTYEGEIRASLDNIYRNNWGISLHDVRISGVRYPYDDEFILGYMRDKMEQLILNVTDDCIFRCKYCIYGGNYEGVREHRKMKMNWDIGIQAVNEFAERSKSIETVCLGFYGGEPLIEWDMIKGLVRYAKGIMRDRKVVPSMTTNGWLITPEKFEFLRDNRFMLAVSLDGDEEIHDRNRVTAGKRGTYETIIKNLEMLREWDAEYYRDYVDFTFVVENPFEVAMVDDAFEETDLTKGHFATGGFVDRYDTNMNIIEVNGEEELRRFLREMDVVVDNYIGYLTGERRTCGVGGALFSPTIKKIRDREMRLINGTTPTSGICIPGVRKLFVTTEGKYHPCEKAEHFNIGSVHEGFDEEGALKLMRDYERMSEGLCDKCWAVRLCPSCYMTGSIQGKLDKGRQTERCKESRDVVDNSLKLYVYLLRRGVDLVDKVTDGSEGFYD